MDARELFHSPDVADPKTLDYKWEAPDVEGLVKFLVVDKGFNEARVRTGAERLNKGLKTTTQGEFYIAFVLSMIFGVDDRFGRPPADERHAQLAWATFSRRSLRRTRRLRR